MKYLTTIILLICVFIQPLYSEGSTSVRPEVSGKESTRKKEEVSKKFDFTKAGVRVILSRKNSKLVVDFPNGDHYRFFEGSFRYERGVRKRVQGKGPATKSGVKPTATKSRKEIYTPLTKTANGFESSRIVSISVRKWHLVLKKKSVPTTTESGDKSEQAREETIIFSGGFMSFGGGAKEE